MNQCHPAFSFVFNLIISFKSVVIICVQNRLISFENKENDLYSQSSKTKELFDSFVREKNYPTIATIAGIFSYLKYIREASPSFQFSYYNSEQYATLQSNKF